MAKFEGKSYDDIKKSVQSYLENPPMIVLPGGSWCHFCQVELCRNPKHRSPQMLLIVVNKLMRDLEEVNWRKFKDDNKLMRDLEEARKDGKTIQ